MFRPNTKMNQAIIPPYSPDLSAFRLPFCWPPLKDALRGRRSAGDDELKRSVREEFRRFRKSFTRKAYGVSRIGERIWW